MIYSLMYVNNNQISHDNDSFSILMISMGHQIGCFPLQGGVRECELLVHCCRLHTYFDVPTINPS